MSEKTKVSQISDFFIRCLLGTIGHEHLLLNFINAFMADSGLPTFIKVDIINPYNLKLHKDNHQTIVDVKCTTETHDIVIVEIQATEEAYFTDRALYYWAENYVKLERKRIEYAYLKSVISINVVNFCIDTKNDQPHTTYTINCKETRHILTDKFLMHFLELPKIATKLKTKELVGWFKYLTSKNLEADMAEIIKDNPELKDAFNYYKEFSLDKDLIDEYTKHEMYIRRQNDLIQQAEEKGIEKEKIEIAKNMLLDNEPIDKIMKYTNLNKSGIEKIKEQL